MFQFGPVGIALIAIAAVVVLGVVALVLRATVFSRRKGRKHERTGIQSDGRIAVLETREIDEQRKLVLVRCDDVEHLIVIGGPADLVVESDVKKARPQTPGQRASTAHPLQPAPTASSTTSPPRVPAATGASLDAAIAAIVPKGADTTRASSRPTAEPRPPLQSRTGLSTVAPRATPRSAEAPSAPARKEAARPAAQRSPASDHSRRDAASSRRATPQAQLPARISDSSRPQASNDRFARSGRSNARGDDSGGLPTAQVPWTEPDSIEEEIVQALRFEPLRSETPSSRREPPAAKAVVDSSTTLGDLADRLEEALAREIQAVGPSTRHEPEPEEGAKRTLEADTGRAKRPAARDRQEKREQRAEPAKPASEAASEPTREAPPAERREEAPVISLNARRREAEAGDPLEDEMARLLGELTGDNKGR